MYHGYASIKKEGGMTSSTRQKRLPDRPRDRLIRLNMFDHVHIIDRDLPDPERNLANLVLHFEREEQELEEDGELPPDMVNRIKKKKIGRSKRCCPVCLGRFQKGKQSLFRRGSSALALPASFSQRLYQELVQKEVGLSYLQDGHEETLLDYFRGRSGISQRGCLTTLEAYLLMSILAGFAIELRFNCFRFSSG